MESEKPPNMQDFIQQQEQEDREESLSLSDLPISKNENNTPKHSRSSSRSELQQDFFQFFSDQLNPDNMCAAEDVIFHGKLIPFNQKQIVSNVDEKTKSWLTATTSTSSLRKRSESLSEIKSVSRTNSTRSAALMRNSRSLDYRKLRRSSSSVVIPEIERNSSVKSVGKSEAFVKKIARPRWFLLMFGMVKFPAEMELNDIKNRQSRMNPTSFLTPTETCDRSFPSSGSNTRKGSWRLLKALSCKDHASVAATAPFYMSHV